MRDSHLLQKKPASPLNNAKAISRGTLHASCVSLMRAWLLCWPTRGSKLYGCQKHARPNESSDQSAIALAGLGAGLSGARRVDNNDLLDRLLGLPQRAALSIIRPQRRALPTDRPR